jgi:predicted 3-demethylubiquinone-9 3-methyltransferase (glyoxalase superfamily)
MSVTFELDGQVFYALNGGPNYKFTPAVSFYIACKDQKEVDFYWTRLLKGGEPNRCAG